ncbi:MAG: winged helix-turn-helix domain-containing protein [Boseongicola sp.]|nr:winged helix-turn-helix domain-containing protein [Boseongicola sp.]MDD9979029.1 winged helix-turn-helix domain-containing protein [Boseongicola sp.]
MRHEKNTKSRNWIAVGTCFFDVESAVLQDESGKELRLRHQSGKVLGVLARAANEVVAKDDIVEQVWGGIATTDDSLVQCIADIRRLVGRDAIETIPKTGYRLNASPVESHKGPVTKNARAAIVAVCALLLVGIGWWSFFGENETNPQDNAVVPPPILAGQTLAVLPFIHLGQEDELRFFTSGLSEDLTTSLAKVADLTVIAPGSSFDFPDAESGFRRIAEDLNVRYLVRGTVRHHDNWVRINVSLIDAVSNANLWAESYDRDRADPFDVQQDVTRRIVGALSLELDVDASVATRVEPDAFYMLLKGMEKLRQHSATANLEARQFFEQAVALDPDYARGHANIAVTYGRETVLARPEQVSRAQIEKGLQAAVTAIQLDPEIPHAYLAVGVLNLALGAHDNAMAAARHAIRLDPNFAEGYALLAEASVLGGDLAEGQVAIQRAKRLHPHHSFYYDWLEGQILFHQEDFPGAIELFETVEAENPGNLLNLIAMMAAFSHVTDSTGVDRVRERIDLVAPDIDWNEAADRFGYSVSNRTQRIASGLES